MILLRFTAECVANDELDYGTAAFPSMCYVFGSVSKFLGKNIMKSGFSPTVNHIAFFILLSLSTHDAACI